MSSDKRAEAMRRPRTVARPRVPPGALHDLKLLLHKLYAAAGTPSLDDIAALAAADDKLPGSPSRDTVWRCLASAELPPNQADAVAVAVVLARLARWDVQDATRRVKQYWVDERLRPSQPLRSVGGWSPAGLGVHLAIRASGRGDTQESDDEEALTAYLPRQHDELLRRRLRAARDGAAVLAVLVGGSCTGKTRAIYEAVAECLPDWPLLVPRDVGQLWDWLAADAIAAGTVLWLDEAQRYLPAAAEPLAGLLDRMRPLVVVGAVWPAYWNILIAQSGSTSVAPVEDAVFHARRLIERHVPRITVADRFTPAHQRDMRALGRGDARVAAALSASESDGRVIQHLAGGPELVDRYEDGYSFSPVEHAVITAALDARRLGHTTPIPAQLLAEAAAATLPSRLRVAAEPQWIGTVLDRICHDPHLQVHGALTALIPDRLTPGMGPPDGYQPADYLDQYARRTRRFHVPPQAFWDAAARHARTSDDLVGLARSARDRWRLRHADQLFRKAADAGNGDALWDLAERRERARDHKEAKRLARQAADAGDTGALRNLAQRRLLAGDRVSAEQLLRLAADAGDIDALRFVARLRGQAGDHKRAERLARQAADGGNTDGLWDLAVLREQAGDRKGAERLARLAADGGNIRALRFVAERRDEAGDQEGAECALRRLADAGDTFPLWHFAKLREQAGDHVNAGRLLHLAADAGNGDALWDLAERRERAGNRKEAERLARQAADAGNTGALWDLAVLREQAGDRVSAEQLLRLAADAGYIPAVRDLIGMREEAGDHETAEQLARQAADAGNTHVLQFVAHSREEAGDHDGAERLARQAADGSVLWDLAEMREEAGDHDGAERLARQAADAGTLHALRELARLRKRAGDRVSAERLLRLAVGGGDIWAVRDLVGMREEAGDHETAEQLARQAADAGNTQAFRELAEQHQAEPQWGQILRYGLEADGNTSDPW